jgi:hypothetical protein
VTLNHDLRIKQGETWRRTFPVYNAAGGPLDLTGCTVRGQVRATKTSGSVLHTWVTGLENIALAPGQVTLYVPAAVSSAWTWTAGRWDLELTDTAGDVTRLVEGVVLVDPEVTR